MALLAALLAGGAAYLVGWFNDLGKKVSVTRVVEPQRPFLWA